MRPASKAGHLAIDPVLETADFHHDFSHPAEHGPIRCHCGLKEFGSSTAKFSLSKNYVSSNKHGKAISKNAGFLRQPDIPANTINQREAAVSQSRFTNQSLMVENLMSN
jgi:hypothetical protein